METVIFRKEFDEYRKAYNYLAVFPGEQANAGRVCAVPFYENGGNVWFEPFCEISMAYYYAKTRLVHKNTDEARRCAEIIKRRYGGEYRIMEKMKS